MMGDSFLVISFFSLLAGSLHLASFGRTLDWTLVAVFALPLALTANLLHLIVPGLLSILTIRFRIHQKLAHLFDIPKAQRTETDRPILFKCRTTNQQIFPEKGAFEYSHFLAGIPVGPKFRDGGILTAERPTEKECGGGSACLEVRAEYHLHRGGYELGLCGKLEAYLASNVSIESPF